MNHEYVCTCPYRPVEPCIAEIAMSYTEKSVCVAFRDEKVAINGRKSPPTTLTQCYLV